MPNHLESLVQLSSTRIRDRKGHLLAVDSPRTIDTLPVPYSAAIDALYLHVPFCFHKCHYCDFYSIVDSQDRQAAFVQRMCRELEAVRPRLNGHVQSVFVGGGTPTLLKPELLHSLLCAVRETVGCRSEGSWEFTVEANPETVTPQIAQVLGSGGVNRVSLGCQTFNADHLKTLERWHEPASVARAVSGLRHAGILNINLDLIFAIPGQSLEQWRSDLAAAISLEPTHLSCYGLTYEPNTPLTTKMRAGSIVPADNELEAAMCEMAIDVLAQNGFRHYEISNWARDAEPGGDYRCRHNLAYWQNRNWWPLGPSASGHVDGVRWKNSPKLSSYLDAPCTEAIDIECLDADGRAGECFMLGLRLIDGMPMHQVDALLDQPGVDGVRRRKSIAAHVFGGLLEISGPWLRLTRRGVMLADHVLRDLI